MLKFSVFNLSQIPDQDKRVQAFEDALQEFELAEELGYDTAWVAEHHFSEYGVVGSTQVFMAAIAARTNRLKIGAAVVVIPFNHPIRTAEDFALVDILSKGRLKMGVGRAYQPQEFAGLGVPMEKSRELFAEGMDILIKAWTNEFIEYHGEFYTISPPVRVLPKPVQEPHPPIYMATITPPSFQIAAKQGYHLQLAAPFSYRIYRHEWIDHLAETLAKYEAEARQNHIDISKVERAILLPFFVAESAQEARDLYAEHVEWFYNKVSGLERPAGEQKVVKGYEFAMTEGAKTKAAGLLNFKNLYEARAAVAGDPDYCIQQLNYIGKRLGITEFILWFNLGGIPAESVRRSMKLAAERVIPYVTKQ